MAIVIDTDICTGCGRCAEACPMEAITINESIRKAVVDAALCTECGACIDKCKKGAISFSSGKITNKSPFTQGREISSGRGGSGSSTSWGQGRGRGGGSGSGGQCGRGNRQKPDVIGECYCPGCGLTIPHKAGIPCSQIKCPRCGGSLIRK